MKFSLKILAIVVVAGFAISMIGCSAPQGFSYSNVSISLTAYCSDCSLPGVVFNPADPMPSSANASTNTTTIPAGAVVDMATGGTGAEGGVDTFTATVNNAPASSVTWAIYPTPNLNSITSEPTGTSVPVGESSSPVGFFESTAGPVANYATPSGVPVYSGEALIQAQALGIPQGDILLVASVPNSPSNPASVSTFNQLIQVYSSVNTYLNPKTSTTPSGQTQPEVTVPRNTSFAFYGGAVGAPPCGNASTCATISSTAPLYTTDNTVIWAVGPAPESLTTAVAGGNSTWGTITSNGVYTAPATIPGTCSSGCTSIAGEVVVYVEPHTGAASSNVSYAYVAID